MMKKFILQIMSLLLLATACSKDDMYNDGLSPSQRALLGSAVNFQTSKADAFQTRTTYNETGVFNEGDMMVIYRQYVKDDGSFDWQTESFRVYQYKYTMIPGTNEWIKRDWEVYENRKKGDYEASGSDRTLTLSNQDESDSITWENGKTVRFRSWGRSNLSGALGQGKDRYYPDFMVSDWVTVSGPTQSIPMTLKHLGSRIFFSVRNSGNTIQKVEIALDEADYSRDDNADTNESDNADKVIRDADGNEIDASTAVANVRAAFNKMCLPAGVDIETGLLMAMTQNAYDTANDAFFQRIEEQAYNNDGKIVHYGQFTSEQVSSQLQHPGFVYNNNNYSFITIPYDISSDHGGEPITLPPYTRFKVTLLDVSQTGQLETTYHIFSLNDVLNDTKTGPLYPKGLEMQAGYSYQFRIGYRYNTLTIESDNQFSWDEQQPEQGQADDMTQTVTAPGTYTWWKNAINTAVNATINSSNVNYAPEFHISSVEDYLDFIRLVNGDAGKAESLYGPIYRLVQEYDVQTKDDGTIIKTPSVYGWSTVNDQNHPQFVERSLLEARGYVFYEHYYPSDGNCAAYSEEDYLRGGYSFYDNVLNRHFKVILDNDLNFQDQKIDPVGKEGYPFKGVFDGYSNGHAHQLIDVNVSGNYIFGYVMDAAVSNLLISTSHSIGLVKKAVPTMNGTIIAGWGCYISGISVKANNQVAGINAIAGSLTGPSYVVGCIHEGDASGPLVGSASDLRMYGCMRTAPNISGAALLGSYENADNKFFAPQISWASKNYTKKPSWGRFMCNYYNKDEHELCKDAKAVSDIPDDYSILEYIRGRQSRILRALNDNMLNREIPYDKLSNRQLEEFYGLAPWKAMNYAIYKYNKEDKGKDYPCMVHFRVRALGNGYDHTYPQLIDGKPGDEASAWDVLKQPN